MMSIYADDALCIYNALDNKGYSGGAEVPRYAANVSCLFRPEHHRIVYTPAMRLHEERRIAKAARNR